MPDTTIGITSDVRDDLRKFRNACGEDYIYAEAIAELLSIAAKEGYWDGEGSTKFASAKRLDRIEERQDKLYQLVQSLKES